MRRKPSKRKFECAASITDEEFAAFEAAFPGLSLLDGVTDEQWDNVLQSARDMNSVGGQVDE